ncbi:hypothetical protein LSH36_717g01034 [Paralvinella palmiformis]|uniref:Uncharacterized protein n=1 Tax=Paralvinella palmiformis TaxID=53620 RepID=A0AAD9J2U0_9ANNE|nr:hypothetical protein LSH36_717g01034 [Paralvinella palmiformis]
MDPKEVERDIETGLDPEQRNVQDTDADNNNPEVNIREQKTELSSDADAISRDTIIKEPEAVTPRSRDSEERLSFADGVVVIPESALSKQDKVAVFRDFVDWQKKTEKEYTERQSPWIRIWKDNCILLVSYLLGVLSFAILFHVRDLPKLPFPVINNLEDWNPEVTPYIWWSHGAILVEILWVFTLIRRSLFIVLTSIRSQPIKMPLPSRDAIAEGNVARSRMWQCLLGAGAVLYHAVFGTWLGWANNAFCGYMTSDKEFIISGMVTYLVGELTIIIGDAYFLCRKTTENVTFRKFRLAAEIFIWTGFGLVSFTLPAVFLFISRFAILTFVLYIPERPSCLCLV